ncbi:hypothetical protein KY331_04835 [Candidatus Woesearchaeota archaeon]|nr:hypothetical protein [Candidatus Woesearchaeota archaeon]
MNQEIIKEFEHSDWDSQWSGNWSVLSFSYWGPFYSAKPFSELVDQYVQRTIIIWRDGKSTAYQRHSEKGIFSEKIVNRINENENIINEICMNLIEKTDEFLSFVEEWIGKDITFEQYKEYQEKLLEYYRWHIPAKVSVDYLPKDILDKALSKFEKARLHAERVFSKSIEFTKALSEIHAKKTGYPQQLIRAMLKDEFEEYYQGGELPAKDILEERNKASAYLFLDGQTYIFTGKDVEIIDSVIVGDENKVIKGNVAYKGKATGITHIVVDPSKAENFREGDILVTGMTRPEYLPLMKKAAAIITDGGGVLCHAAIVARELKKPCVIATKNATKLLKDGDLVEVDAEKGIVRKINK